MREFFYGCFILTLGQEFDGLLSTKRVGGVGQLRMDLRGRRREGDLGQQG